MAQHYYRIAARLGFDAGDRATLDSVRADQRLGVARRRLRSHRHHRDAADVFALILELDQRRA